MPYSLPLRGLYGIFILTHMADIHVEKEGRRAFIPLAAWQIMPDHKYGWQPVRSEIPEVVTKAMATVEAKADTQAPQKVKKTRKKRGR